MPKNDWEKQFGAKRRAIDKALLAECERRIAAEEKRTEETRPLSVAELFGKPLTRIKNGTR